MANKNIYSRIQLKHDTEENWNKATNFTPLNGEVIIYDSDASNEKPRIKIGDGITKLSVLKFFSGELDEINGGTW